MEIVLGVSMTPATVRMVVVEGEKADGVIVDHEVFDIAASDDEQLDGSSDQVIAAILGTCESAAEGGHHLISTGVTWSDRTQAAILRHELAALNIEDVTFVSELHAAEALAQAVCGAAGYERCALMFVESDTATLSVVESANGSIIKVQSQGLEGADAVAELAAMVAGLEELQPQPQGLFLVGSGVNVRAIKPRIEMATSLPVSAPDEPELALARGAALASANAPRFEASTVGLGYSQDPDGTTAGKRHSELDAGATHVVGPSDGRAAAVLACSTAPDDNHGRDEIVEAQLASLEGRKPFLLAGSALTSVFVLGVVALLFSLAVSSRLTVDQRPNPAEGVTVPSRQAPASAAPEAAVPTPAAALPAPTATARVLAPPAPARPPVVVRNVAPAPVAPPPPAPVLAPPVPIIQLPGLPPIPLPPPQFRPPPLWFPAPHGSPWGRGGTGHGGGHHGDDGDD